MASCNNTVTTPVGTFYFIRTTSENFTSAILKCRSDYNSKLAVINSNETFTAAVQSFKSCYNNYYWIGLGREGSNSNAYQWIDGSPFQPNDIGESIQKSNIGGSCIGTCLNQDGNLSTFQCSQTIPYLCFNPRTQTSTSTASQIVTTQSVPTVGPVAPVNVGLIVGLSLAFLLIASIICVSVLVKRKRNNNNHSRFPKSDRINREMHLPNQESTETGNDVATEQERNPNDVYNNHPKDETGYEYSTLNNVARGYSNTAFVGDQSTTVESSKAVELYAIPIKRNKQTDIYTTIK
uniref:C-type lectin domain-containing protein n=1 Tax=Ciona savignyi TaxID=51511 RepID=H2YG47_CIOSA